MQTMNRWLVGLLLIGIAGCNSEQNADDGMPDDRSTMTASDVDTRSDEAFKQALELAEEGDIQAVYMLGYYNYYGRGVEQDYAQAEKWYRKAGEQGHLGAQISIGEMYEGGHGVPRDYAEALKWFRRAAERGNDSAQFWLGRMHLKGNGVPQDDVEAYAWLTLAASKGNVMADFDLVIAENRLSPKQLADGENRVRELRNQQIESPEGSRPMGSSTTEPGL